MEKERKERVKHKRRKSDRRDIRPKSIADDYFPSTLPSRDMEIPTVTTVSTVQDYLRADRANPRDLQFADKIVVVPILTEKEFVGTQKAISDFIHDVRNTTEEKTSSYRAGEIILSNQETYIVLQLRERYFSSFPCRIVLLPKDSAKRTFGVYTTEKVLEDISASVEAAI